MIFKSALAQLAYVGFASLVFLSACTKKTGEAINPHSPSVLKSAETATSTNTQSNLTVEQLDALEKFEKLDWREIEAAKNSTDEARVAGALKLIAPYFFDPRRLQLAEWTTSSEALNGLNLLNQLIAKLSNLNASNPTLVSVKSTYLAAIKSGCDATWSGCRNLKFFSQDSQSSSLIVEEAQKAKDLKTKYRLLKLAIAMSPGGVGNDTITKIWVENFVPFIEENVILRKLEGTSALSAKDASAAGLTDLKSIFEVTATLLRGGSRDEHSQTLRKDSKKLFGYLSISGAEFFFGKSLMSALNQAVLMDAANDEFKAIYTNELKAIELKDQSYESLKKAVLRDSPDFRTELTTPIFPSLSEIKNDQDFLRLYILNKIAMGADSDQILPLWSKVQGDLPAMIALFKSHLELSVVAKSIFTSKEMAKFFADYIKRGRSSSMLFSESHKWGETYISQEWAKFHIQSLRIRTFFETHIERSSKYRADDIAQKSIADLRNFFKHINDNIKMMATYPAMIMMAYYAAKLNFVAKVHFFGTTFTITKEAILDSLVRGGLQPMYRFTSYERDGEALNPLQTNWALYYTIRLGVLKHYGISTEDFVKTFFVKFVEIDRKRMIERINKINEELKPASSTGKFLGYCQSWKNKHGFINTIPFKNLDGYTFLGKPTDSAVSPVLLASNDKDKKKMIDYLFTTHYFEMVDLIDEDLEVIRSDIDPKLRILELFKTFVRNTPGSKPEDLKATDDAFKSFIAMRSNYIKVSTHFFEATRDCIKEAQKIERQRTRDILEMELNFADDIFLAFDALSKYRQHSSKTVSELRVIQNHKIFSHPHFAGLQQDVSLIKALNQWYHNLEIKKYAHKEIQGLEDIQKSQTGFFVTSNGQYYLSFFGYDVLLRVASYLRHGYFDKKRSFEGDELEIQLPASLRILIANADNQNLLKKFSIAEPDLRAQTQEAAITAQLGLKKEFVRFLNGLTYYYGAMTYDLRMARSLFKTDVALLKFRAVEEVDLEAQSQCKDQCFASRIANVRTEVSKLLSRVDDNYSTFPLDQWGKRYLKYFDASGFYHLRSRALNEPEQPSTGFQVPDKVYGESAFGILYGLYDYAFYHLISINLGGKTKLRDYIPSIDVLWKPTADDLRKLENKEKIDARSLIEHRNFYSEAQKIAKTIYEQKDSILYKMNDSVRESVSLQFQIIPFWDMRLALLFYEETQKRDMSQLPLAQYSLSIQPAKPFPLSSSLMGQYTADMKIFNRKTYNVFLPPELKSSVLAPND